MSPRFPFRLQSILTKTQLLQQGDNSNDQLPTVYYPGKLHCWLLKYRLDTFRNTTPAKRNSTAAMQPTSVQHSIISYTHLFINNFKALLKYITSVTRSISLGYNLYDC